MNVGIFSEGSLFWIMGHVLEGFISQGISGLIAIAGIWLLLRSRIFYSNTTATGSFQALFVSILIAQIATILVFSIYVAAQLKWALMPSFSEGIQFFKNQHHFLFLSALVPVGLMLCVFIMKNTNDWRWSDLGIRKPVTGKFQIFNIVAAAIVLTEVVYIGWGHISDTFRADEKFDAFSSVSTAWKSFYLVWLFTIAPLLEELLFRGVILKVSSQIAGIRAGIVFQAIIFTAMHDSYVDYIPIFLFGIILGTVYARTKSIWFPTIVHSVTNFLALIGVSHGLI